MPEWLEPMDHTADVGFVVTARGLEELFARAAWAMFSVITDVDTVLQRERVAVSVEADDRVDLMRQWLSDLNYRHLTERRLFSGFDVKSADDHRLSAQVCGEAIDLSRHPLHAEIKAVTFHGLEVRQSKGVWEARVLFDV
ncbi:archease [Verrucomicrobiota bacterium]